MLHKPKKPKKRAPVGWSYTEGLPPKGDAAKLDDVPDAAGRLRRVPDGRQWPPGYLEPRYWVEVYTAGLSRGGKVVMAPRWSPVYLGATEQRAYYHRLEDAKLAMRRSYENEPAHLRVVDSQQEDGPYVLAEIGKGL